MAEQTALELSLDNSKIVGPIGPYMQCSKHGEDFKEDCPTCMTICDLKDQWESWCFFSCSSCLSNFECTCFAMAVSALHANIVVACLSMHVSCLDVSTAWLCCTACFLLKYALFMCVITHVCRWSKWVGQTDAHATCTSTTTQQAHAHMHYVYMHMPKHKATIDTIAAIH